MASKVWFITGTSKGFGRIWAEAALARGDRVAATARDVKSLAPLVERYGNQVSAITLDVTDKAAVAAAITEAHSRFGRLDVVVNNAGYGAMRSFSQVMQVRKVPGLELPGIDFVRIAQGMGCDAARVSKASELAPALKRGTTHDGVSLIEVMVDSAVPLLYARKK